MKKLSLIAFCTLQTLSAIACCCFPTYKIDSLSQLDKYSFIALVTVTKVGDTTVKFEINELFKGNAVQEVLQPLKSGCMQLASGEGWLIFAEMQNGKPTIRSCDRTVKYSAANGERYWQYLNLSPYVFQRLKELYNKLPPPHKDGTEIAYYKNGQKEIEENYLGGQLHGERKIWYANGRLQANEYYAHGKPDGKITWFYPTGQVRTERYYRNGKDFNVSRSYYDSSHMHHLVKSLSPIYETNWLENGGPRPIQVEEETVFSPDGLPVIERKYSRGGNISQEIIRMNGHVVDVRYYPNGMIESIYRSSDDKPTGRYEYYNQLGVAIRAGEYSKKGIAWPKK